MPVSPRPYLRQRTWVLVIVAGIAAPLGLGAPGCPSPCPACAPCLSVGRPRRLHATLRDSCPEPDARTKAVASVAPLLAIRFCQQMYAMLTRFASRSAQR